MEVQLTDLTSLCENISKTVSFLAKKVNRDELDITHYFPISSRERLAQFMSNADGMFEKRSAQFEDLLYATFNPLDNPNLAQNSQKFSESLIALLFDRNWLATNRWPTLQYVQITYIHSHLYV